jgi:predicted nucleic acid-binding protein
MKNPVIVDAGPLVALLDRRERHHAWAHQQFKLIESPAITCESVITEAYYLVRESDRATEALMQLLLRGHLTFLFRLADELPAIERLLKRYASVPMSLADACLVRMSEQFAESPILTLDRDFRVYRKHGRTVIPTLMPE